MKVKSTDELFDAVMNRKSFVSVDESHITINVKYAYKIERARCDTPVKLLGWIVHLCEKTWVTPEVLREFAHVAAHAADFKINFA